MNATIEEVKAKINGALSRLYGDDYNLIANKSNEKTITARLALYLNPLFSSWDVDVEYNRDGNETKKDTKRDIILPDIVIHHRTPGREKRHSPENNLVALEVKGYWNHKDRNGDERKLRDMKKRYGYQYIFRIELGETMGEIIAVSEIDLDITTNSRGQHTGLFD